jgi:arsenate reductase (thioredoxin)
MNQNISSVRAHELALLSDIIAKLYQEKEDVNIMFVCTHNSRRSHLAQLMFTFAAARYGMNNINVYSSGTEVTRIHKNILASLERKGYGVCTDMDDAAPNPIYQITDLATGRSVDVFSKRYDDMSIPKENLIAVMVCDSAQESCPYIPGTYQRYNLTYIDPKRGDDTPECDQIYDETVDIIALEMDYLAQELSQRSA